MSETTAERRESVSREAARGEKKIFGINRTYVIAGAVALAGAVAWFIWKSRSSASTSSTSVSASASAGAYDYSGQLSAIQTELEALQQEEGASSSGAGVTGVTGTTGTASTATTATAAKSTATTTTTATTTAPKTATTTAPKTTTAAKVSVPPVPSGVKASKTTPTNTTLTWNKSAGATSYQIRVTYQGKLVRSGTASGTTRVVNGLTPDHTYTMHVKACNSAGCSAETNGPVVKTPKS